MDIVDPIKAGKALGGPLAIDGVMVCNGKDLDAPPIGLLKYGLQAHATVGTLFAMYVEIDLHISTHQTCTHFQGSIIGFPFAH